MSIGNDPEYIEKVQFDSSPLGKTLAELKGLLLEANAVGKDNSRVDVDALAKRLNLLAAEKPENEELSEFVETLKEQILPKRLHKLEEAVEGVDAYLSVTDVLFGEEGFKGDLTDPLAGEFRELYFEASSEAASIIAALSEGEVRFFGIYEMLMSLEISNDEIVYSRKDIFDLRSEFEGLRKKIETAKDYIEELGKRFGDEAKIPAMMIEEREAEAFTLKPVLWYKEIVPAFTKIYDLIRQITKFADVWSGPLSRDLNRQIRIDDKLGELSGVLDVAEKSREGNDVVDPTEILRSSPKVKQYFDHLGGQPEVTPKQVQKVVGGHEATVRRTILTHLEPIHGFKKDENGKPLLDKHGKRQPVKGAKYDTIQVAMLLANEQER